MKHEVREMILSSLADVSQLIPPMLESRFLQFLHDIQIGK